MERDYVLGVATQYFAIDPLGIGQTASQLRVESLLKEILVQHVYNLTLFWIERYSVSNGKLTIFRDGLKTPQKQTGKGHKVATPRIIAGSTGSNFLRAGRLRWHCSWIS